MMQDKLSNEIAA